MAKTGSGIGQIQRYILEAPLHASFCPFSFARIRLAVNLRENSAKFFDRALNGHGSR